MAKRRWPISRCDCSIKTRSKWGSRRGTTCSRRNRRPGGLPDHEEWGPDRRGVRALSFMPPKEGCGCGTELVPGCNKVPADPQFAIFRMNTPEPLNRPSTIFDSSLFKDINKAFRP